MLSVVARSSNSLCRRHWFMNTQIISTHCRNSCAILLHAGDYVERYEIKDELHVSSWLHSVCVIIKHCKHVYWLQFTVNTEYSNKIQYNGNSEEIHIACKIYITCKIFSSFHNSWWWLNSSRNVELKIWISSEIPLYCILYWLALSVLCCS